MEYTEMNLIYGVSQELLTSVVFDKAFQKKRRKFKSKLLS